jgi:hypothetical protein
MIGLPETDTLGLENVRVVEFRRSKSEFDFWIEFKIESPLTMGLRAD